jgi:hypothetical protein
MIWPRPVYGYHLIEAREQPDKGTVRMVGITRQKNAMHRFDAHEYQARKSKHANPRVGEMLRAHDALGIRCKDRWRVVACFADWDSACAWERQQIAEYGVIDDGGTLFNIAAGGMGFEAVGIHAREQQNIRRRAGIREAWLRPGARDNWRDSHREAQARPESRAQKRAQMREIWARPEDRAKRIAANRALTARPEWRAKNKVSQRKAVEQSSIVRRLRRRGQSGPGQGSLF